MASFGESPSDTHSRSDTRIHFVVEWSEPLRSVISAWLGAVRRSVQVRLCTSGCKSEKKFGIIIIIIIIMIIIITRKASNAGILFFY